MFKNYFKIALRNLLKHRAYSAINILGLAIGMACFIFIMLYVRQELEHGRFHKNAGRIYRLATDMQTAEEQRRMALSSPAMAPALLRDFPEITAAVRLRQTRGLFRYGENKFIGEQVFYADAAFFEMFTFPLLQGNPETVLAEPNSVVISENTARQYFSNESPLGKLLIVDNENAYKITGVFKDVPQNSHFTFDMLISFATLEAAKPNTGTQWFFNSFYTYLLLPPNVDYKAFEAKLPDFIERHVGEALRQYNTTYTMALEPLTDIYLHSDRTGQIGPQGNVTALYIFSCIAIFILAIACVNFMNLSTARAANRAKEVGLRKVVGSNRRQIAVQFLGEALLISFFAVAAALVLCDLLLPAFNVLAGKSVAETFPATLSDLLIPVALAVVAGLLAGSYPAFVISGFAPARVLKGYLASHASGARLRKALVIAQFAISIFLIIGTLTIYSQLDYIQKLDLGFEKEQILVIDFQNDEQVYRQYEAIKTEMLAHPAVVGVSFSLDTPGDNRLTNFGAQIELGNGEQREIYLTTYIIDHDFLQNYGMEIVAGRAFSREMATDATEAFIINEAAVVELGWRTPEQALGKRFRQYQRSGKIIGVVKDFNFASLHGRVEPLSMHIRPDWFAYVSLRLQTDDLPKAIAELQRKWQALAPHLPFRYRFVDENLGSQYQAEQQFGQLFATFAGLAIFIACLGLLGLAIFMAQQRTKEIGIRKVLGASVTNVATLLSKDFVKLVLLANLIAWPMAWLAMNTWLQNFAYRIDVGWPAFAFAGGLALLIALVTVSTQAIKAALANPVEALRYE